MSKSLKDTYQEIKQKADKTKTSASKESCDKDIEKTLPADEQPNSIDKITEEMRTELSLQIEEQVKARVEKELRSKIEKELSEKIKSDTDVLSEAVIENNRTNAQLIEAITQLNNKLDTLVESLKIEIPTPVVNINVPKVKKKIVRNEKGLIESIVEEHDNDNEDS